MALPTIILLLIAALLLALALFVGDKVFGNRRVELTSGYYINALITAIVILLLIIGVSAIIGTISILGIERIIPILTFVVSVYVIKALLMKGATFERATWVGIITWVVAYMINFIGELINFEPIRYL